MSESGAGRVTGRKLIGVHVGTAGGCWTAVNRAVEAGANTFQIFSSSPRMWRAADVKPEDAAKMKDLRVEKGVGPVSIHASYLINLCSQTESVRVNSTAAFRGEVERALAYGAEFLVLHPGSWKGLTREEGLRLASQSIERAVDGLAWEGKSFRILIENTAGAEFSLGGSLEQVAELVEKLKACAPMGVCLDTCHLHVAGYDLVSAEGYEETMGLIGDTVGFDAVRVWHCNDAKAARGSKLDRHEHIGEGTIGAEAFRRLLHDERFGQAAFIAETPVDAPGDEARNVSVLRTLALGRREGSGHQGGDEMGSRLTGKTCLVTGSAQGIGRAIAHAFLREGATVVATDLQVERLVAEFPHPNARTARMDVTSATEVAAVAAAYPVVNVLVNCAGFVATGTLMDCDADGLRRSFDLNVMSMLHTIRAFLPGMQERKDGSIINIASVASTVMAAPNRFAYGVTKAGVIGLTMSVALDFVGDGVRCNAISPGTVDTPSLHDRMSAQGDFEKARAAFIARQPMGRVGAPEEIAEVAVLLASDEARFMTGSNLVIDGGMSL